MKKTLALFLAMMAVFAFGVCAVTLDTAENAAEVAAEETAVLAAVELKPGLNVYTGTTNPYTFDGAEAVVDTEKFDFTASVETFATSANAENKAMFIDKTYEHFGLKEFPVIELERPVMLKFNVLSYKGQVRYCTISDVVAGKEKADVVTTLDAGNFSYTAKASTQTGTKVANQGASAFVDSYSADYEGKPFENIYFYGYSGTMNAYVDDLAVIPYYKITYDVNGGNGTVAPSYFLGEDGVPFADLASGEALSTDTKQFVGWAEFAEATEDDVVDMVFMTPGEDKTLYAVYKDVAFVEVVKPGINLFTGTADNYTFDGDEEDISGFLSDKAEIVTYANTTNEENKALRFNARNAYFALKEFPQTVSLERPFQFEIDFVYSGQIRLMANATYDAGLMNKKDAVVILSSASTNWSKASYAVSPVMADSQGVGGQNFFAQAKGIRFPNLFIYMFSNINTPSYIDNVSIKPHYQVTYDLNGGTGAEIAPKYFYTEPGIPYALADGSALTKNGQPFAGWSTKADATVSEAKLAIAPTPGEDLVVYAVYGTEEEEEEVVLKPGLNMYTGTTSAYTFSGEEADISGFLTNGAAVQTLAQGDDTTNKVLKFTKGDQYFGFKKFPVTEADRPFSVKLDVYYTGQVRIMDNDKYDSALETKADVVVIYSGSNGWKNNLSYTIKGTQTTSAGTSGHYSSDYYGDAFKNLFVYSYNSATAVDNLNITPYYKLNFEVNGGTGTVAPEYFLVNEGTSYTIKTTSPALTKGDETFCGWALTADATSDDIVTAVTPKLGEDITLYAVYDKPITITLVKDGAEYAKYDSTAGKEITVNNSYFADAENYYVNWQTEDGKAVIAHKYTFEDSATLTAVKYARKMTVGENAFSNGDFEEDYVEVRATAGNLFIVEDDAEHGNVLKYQRINSGYGSIQRGVIWETGRMYRLEYDVKTLSTGTTSSWNTIFGGKDHAHNGPQTVAGEWVHESHDFQHTATDAAQTSDVITFYMNPLPAGVENVIYYDNLKLIPYHKVTFNANGAEGTAPAIDWTLAKTYEITAGAGEMVKDGFYLAGWSLTADGEAVASVDTVVGEDIELFAVWAPVADENAPESDEESFSMRAGDKAGMRFYASVTAAQRNEATEYGFVAARADILNAIGVNAAELNLGLTYNGAGEGKLFVKGAAYIKDGDNVTLDKYLEETDDGGVIYAAVCTGLDITNKTQVTTQFVLRPYINIGGVYAYGKPVVKSLYEIAAEIDASTLPEDVVDYINTIIATATAE